MAEQGKPIRGTREWAVANIDCCTGCPHDCRYCYARYDAVYRKGEVTAQAWRQCRIRQKDVERQYPRYDGQVMFPTTHDIVAENLKACITVLRTLLLAGNRVLVVSKPHYACVRTLCERLAGFREQLLFRLTITARDADILAYWEPHAPPYDERRASLRYAHECGFHTSVSVEPMLDTPDVVDMVHDLLPFVDHSIWLGKMNKIDQRVEIITPADRRQVERIVAGQTDDKIAAIYKQLRDEPLVRWKESIKVVVGIEPAQAPGLDR